MNFKRFYDRSNFLSQACKQKPRCFRDNGYQGRRDSIYNLFFTPKYFWHLSILWHTDVIVIKIENYAPFNEFFATIIFFLEVPYPLLLGWMDVSVWKTVIRLIQKAVLKSIWSNSAVQKCPCKLWNCNWMFPFEYKIFYLI